MSKNFTERLPQAPVRLPQGTERLPQAPNGSKHRTAPPSTEGSED